MHKNKLQNALASLRKYVESLLQKINKEEIRDPSILISMTLGTHYLNLSDDDARKYLQLTQSLVDAVSDERFSRLAIEAALRKALFIGIGATDEHESMTFEDRWRIGSEDLIQALRARPTSFRYFCPVGPMAASELPASFGSVTFRTLDEQTINQMYDSPQEYLSKSPLGRTYAAPPMLISKTLCGAPIAEVTVEAVDKDAAKALGLRLVRTTANVLNFLSGHHSQPFVGLYVPGDRSVETLHSLLLRESVPHELGASQGSFKPAAEFSLKVLSAKHPDAYQQASHLLMCKGELAERIVSAMQWAGASVLEPRSEQGFLLNAIALEGIILADNDHAELVNRLATRVAHLLGEDIAGRKQISKLIKALYAIRSGIVHSGKIEISETDLDAMRQVVRHCLWRILTHLAFQRMSSLSELRDWFDDRVFQ